MEKPLKRRIRIVNYRYEITTGAKRLKTKLAIAFSALALVGGGTGLSLALAGASHAATSTYTVTPWTFVGTAADCGGTAGTGPVVSKWDNTTGNPAPSLYLQKDTVTSDCSSAGATINGVEGINLTSLSFQYENDNGGHCGAGAPRFNVVTSDDVTHFFGCTYGVHTDLGNGWTQVDFVPGDGLPVVQPTDTVKSIDIVFDEGTDQGSGFVNLDNISVNGVVASAAVTAKSDCLNGGWKNLTTTTGSSFKNQGLCVAYTNHSDGVGQDDVHAHAVRQ